MKHFSAIEISQFSDPDLAQFLGRDLIRPDLEPLRSLFAGTVVMVTGAAGSIGAELCSQLLSLGPKALVCVDHDETALFNLEHRLFPKTSTVHHYVDDFGDAERMRSLLVEHRVNAVFHAAAYKHVPLMERNPGKALKNNVFALQRFVEAAEDAAVNSFLLTSSDKAVNPTSVMGCTKRIGELLLAARPDRRMRCMSVRFGNVFASQGSVLPVFQQQLRNGEPLSVTHPEVTRYFMTIPEAASLLLHAFAIGEPNDILVLNVGVPISVLRMAKTLISFAGLSESSVPILFSGLRRGEKLHEELFYSRERRLPTRSESIVRAEAGILRRNELEPLLCNLESLVASGNEGELRQAMQAIVPEYQMEAAPPPQFATASLNREIAVILRSTDEP